MQIKWEMLFLINAPSLSSKNKRVGVIKFKLKYCNRFGAVKHHINVTLFILKTCSSLSFTEFTICGLKELALHCSEFDRYTRVAGNNG